MNKIVIGLVLLGIGIWAVSSWWWFIFDVIKGLVAILLVLAGLALIGIGVKNNGNKTECAEAGKVK